MIDSHMTLIKENCKHALQARENILCVMTSQNDQEGKFSSITMWRTVNNGWIAQHIASKNSPFCTFACYAVKKKQC